MKSASGPDPRDRIYSVFKEKILPVLSKMSTFLGSKPYLVGSYLTIADLLLFNLLEFSLAIDSYCLKSYRNLDDLHWKVRREPNIDRYYRSSNFIGYPFVNEYL